MVSRRAVRIDSLPRPARRQGRARRGTPFAPNQAGPSSDGGERMNVRHLTLTAGLLGLLSAAPAQNEPPPNPEGVEVLARGPVHEAYAEPTDPHPTAAP